MNCSCELGNALARVSFETVHENNIFFRHSNMINSLGAERALKSPVAKP